ncbi:MAG: hypothetical protein V3S89_01195 [Desulfobacterales bacterium]
MKKTAGILSIVCGVVLLFGCGPSYKIKPVSFKSPDTLDNVVSVAGAQVAAKAFVDAAETKEAFGFDIHGAGMFPIQVVFDNKGSNQFEINSDQTFLEDAEGNLWPILSNKIAYERATKHAGVDKMIKEGASKGVLGAAAGAIIGAAIGIVTDEGVASAAGKGAAVGAAAGATLGAAVEGGSGKARRDIIEDLQDKSLRNTIIQPQSIAHGLLFFPGEAKSAIKLRLQIMEIESGTVHNLEFGFI